MNKQEQEQITMTMIKPATKVRLSNIGNKAAAQQEEESKVEARTAASSTSSNRSARATVFSLAAKINQAMSFHKGS